MEVTRILPLQQFDPNKCRFSNVVFKHSSGVAAGTPDGKLGISVFHNDCACEQVSGDCICAHVAKWYEHVFKQPCAYWTFETALLDPPNPNPDQIPQPQLVKSPSDSGDECHYTIHNVGDSRAKKIFDKRVADGFIGLCIDGKGVAFSCELATQLKREHFPDPA